MRTSCIRRCAPSVRRILCRHQALAGHPPGRARHGSRSGGDGSDPAVRGPAAGEWAGARAHPGPRPPGSLPDQRSLAGRRPAASASAHWRCPEVALQSPRATPAPTPAADADASSGTNIVLFQRGCRISFCVPMAFPAATGSAVGHRTASERGLDGLPARDLSYGSNPEGGGRVVKTHSPLRRTEPSARGVAPATARVARSATGGRAAWPHDVACAVDARPPRCESQASQTVNRPPTSNSHSSTA